MYKVPWKGKFIKSVGEEYQAVKGGREYHGCEEEYKRGKKEREARLLGRILSGEGEEYQDNKKMWVGKNMIL